MQTKSLLAATKNSDYLAALEANAKAAAEQGIIGVPTFVIGDEIFWGQDRIDFVIEHLQYLQTG